MSKRDRKYAASNGRNADDLRGAGGSKRAARELQKYRGKAKPRQRCYVPGEPQCARSEPGAAEQFGKIIPTKQSDKDIALSENRVRDTQSEDEKCGEVEHVIQRPFNLSCAAAAASECDRTKTSSSVESEGAIFARLVHAVPAPESSRAAKRRRLE